MNHIFATAMGDYFAAWALVLFFALIFGVLLWEHIYVTKPRETPEYLEARSRHRQELARIDARRKIAALDARIAELKAGLEQPEP